MMDIYSSLNNMSTIMTYVKAPVTFSYNQDAYFDKTFYKMATKYNFLAVQLFFNSL